MSHTIDEIVGKYVLLRDKKKAITDGHKEQLAPYNEAMDQIEAWILNQLQETGAQSVKTSAGPTAYLSTLTKSTVEDPEAFLDYLKSTGRMDLIDLRPNVTAVQDFLEQHSSPPPGVRVRRETFARIRK